MTATTNARRRRVPGPTPAVAVGIGASDQAPELNNLTKPPSWKTIVRWTARVLLLLTMLAASAKVVRVPEPLVSAPDTRTYGVGETTVLLVVTHSRPEYLKRCLRSVLAHHPGNGTWAVVVSQDRQDGESHEDVADVVRAAVDEAAAGGVQIVPWVHEYSYENDVDETIGFVNLTAYRRISRHYKWALSRLFNTGVRGIPALERVVVIEDDMEIAPDFFDYFAALTPVLESDPTLLCVSSWNDNGKPGLDWNPEQLHRTDFFPGLGWMLTRDLWDELAPKWPAMFWDDWLRNSEQTRGRQCIRPEVSRTANFGERGVSQSFHFQKHVSMVALGRDKVNFPGLDFGYLGPDEYYRMFFGRMSRAVQLKYSNYLKSRPQDADVIAFYPKGKLDAISKRTGVMTDDREGVLRTSYHGVVIVPWNKHWAFLVERGWEPPEGYQLGASVCCN